MPLTTAYLRDVAASIGGGTLPAGTLDATWNRRNNGDTAANAKSLSGTPGTAQVNWNIAITAWVSGEQGCSAQFCSPALAAQSVSAGNWALGFVASPSVAQAWKGWAALHLVNGSTGAIRTTIFAGQAIGNTKSAATTYKTCYSNTISGGAFSPQTGDYLCLEVGVEYDFTGNVQTRVRGDGTTAIASDDSTTGNNDAKSFLTAPASVYYSSDVANGTANAGVAAATATAYAATGTGGASVTAAAASATATAYAATATTLVTANAGVAAATAVAYAATATGGANATAGFASATATAYPATSTGGATATADLAEAIAVAYAAIGIYTPTPSVEDDSAILTLRPNREAILALSPSRMATLALAGNPLATLAGLPGGEATLALVAGSTADLTQAPPRVATLSA